MPHSATTTTKHGRRSSVKSETNHQNENQSRYTVGLSPRLAHQVERYAATTDTSMSKAIATLVRLGIESQADRKRVFFKKLKENLANDDPKQQERLVDEFRALILGR
jgi:hypothetical protein